MDYDSEADYYWSDHDVRHVLNLICATKKAISTTCMATETDDVMMLTILSGYHSCLLCYERTVDVGYCYD
jgi:hypothetical protein